MLIKMDKKIILLLTTLMITFLFCGVASAVPETQHLKYISPGNDSQDVPTTKLIKLTFTKNIYSPDTSRIKLQSYTDNVDVPITYTVQGNVMYIDHVPLQNQKTYLLTIKTNFVKDSSGAGSTTNRVFRFKTGTTNLNSFKAKLVIPKMGISPNIRSDTPDAYNAVYHYQTSAYFGTPGECAILGHRTTWSAPLYKINYLRKGDLIYIYDYTAQKKCTYAYQYYQILPNYLVDNNFKKTGNSILILKSCYPIGSGANKYITYSKLVSTVAL